MKLFGKKFALVLALIAVFAMTGSALAAEIIVSETTGGQQNQSYSTVADAVEYAVAGATITIPAGEYKVENVQIDKPLKLIGAGSGEGGTVFKATLDSKGYMLILGDRRETGEDISGTEISGISFELSAAVKDSAVIYYTGQGTAEEPVTIQNCSFSGIVGQGGSNQAIAILTPYSDAGYLVVTNNTVTDTKYAFYFNSLSNATIENNAINNTLYNAINIANTNTSYPCSNVTISNNTMTNISTAENYNEPLYASGINVGTENPTTGINVTDNVINMADGKQGLALNGDSIKKGAQVTTPDGNNVYFSTLTEAVQSDKTAANSTITLLSEPTDEEKNLEIGNGIKITNAADYDYEPNYVETAPTAPAHSGGGGGGCSAGFGALALLAAVPLIFRRKK